MWPLYFRLKIISTVENGCTLVKTCLKLTYLRNFFVADNERWDKLIGFRTCKHVSKNFHGCTKSGFVSAVLRRRGMVTLIGRLQTAAINLVLRVKLCHLLWNPESVTCCDSGTASPLHQCSVRRWHMMDFRTVLFPSPDCRDCLGMLAGPWQAEPPLCFTLINIQLCP